MRTTSPTAIVVRIAQIVIHSFNGHPFRGMTHILKEVLKNTPCSTNGNATATVIVVCFIVWISATLNHIRPNTINLGYSDNASMSMLASVPSYESGFHAATGFRISSLKSGSEYWNFDATNTSTKHSGGIFSTRAYVCRSMIYYSQEAKYITNKGVSSLHWNHINHRA
jgi:hypothetical protein